MKRIFVFSFVMILFCWMSTVTAQSTLKEVEQKLKSLDGSPYLKEAFKNAEELAKASNFEDALKVLDMAAKQAKKMNKGTYAVISGNRAEVIHRLFPKDDRYNREVINSTKEVLKSDPAKSMLTMSLSTMEALKPHIGTHLKSDYDKVYGDVHEELDKVIRQEQAFVASKQGENPNLTTPKISDQEIERLRAESKKLETIQNKLENYVDKSEALLKQRKREINRMTQEQAKKEALLQYNSRIIDSLQFRSALDSVSLINNELKLKEQEAILNFQEFEIQLKDSEIQLKSTEQKFYIVLSILGLVLAGFMSWATFSSRKMNKKLAAQNEIIELEKERSESLLLNILPQFIATELKENSKVKTRTISDCSVIFTDFINFSSITKQLTPQELIKSLDECFREFDSIISKHNIEKIKTIGDAYMCAGGVPIPNETHAIDAVNAAFEMVNFLEDWNMKRVKENKVRFDARIGIHSGPIIAGVVGAKKFAYDIWGDTVNVAARMESQSEAQKINISQTTYDLIKKQFTCEKRGSLSVKNMKDLEMYFVKSRLTKPALV